MKDRLKKWIELLKQDGIDSKGIVLSEMEECLKCDDVDCKNASVSDGLEPLITYYQD